MRIGAMNPTTTLGPGGSSSSYGYSGSRSVISYDYQWVDGSFSLVEDFDLEGAAA